MISIESLSTLTPAEASLLSKHCELSGSMRRIRHLQRFLIDEIHNKRCVLKRTKFKLLHPKLEKPYNQILYAGRESIYSVFPTSYQSLLDSLMFDEFDGTNIQQALTDAKQFLRMTGLYYDPDFAIRELQDAACFDESEWALDDPANDMAVLRRFRDERIAYMCRVEQVATRNLSREVAKDARKLRNERRRYARVCGDSNLLMVKKLI
jgi:hypothetical protein